MTNLDKPLWPKRRPAARAHQARPPPLLRPRVPLASSPSGRPSTLRHAFPERDRRQELLPEALGHRAGLRAASGDLCDERRQRRRVSHLREPGDAALARADGEPRAARLVLPSGDGPRHAGSEPDLHGLGRGARTLGAQLPRLRRLRSRSLPLLGTRGGGIESRSSIARPSPAPARWRFAFASCSTRSASPRSSRPRVAPVSISICRSSGTWTTTRRGSSPAPSRDTSCRTIRAT